MGLLALLDQGFRADDVQAPPGPLDDFWYTDTPGIESDSGIRLSPQGALNISTFWSCANWWFRVYGTLPHKLKERTTELGLPAMVDATNHPLYDLIHAAPNPAMTSAFFHGLIPVDKLMWGAFYAFIQRNPVTGKVDYLWRLRPDYVTPKLLNGQLVFEVRGDKGVPQTFFSDEILYLPAISRDGRVGLSAVRANAELFSWNKATVRYGSAFFKNASRPSGIISATNPVQPEAKKELIANLRASGKEAGKLIFINGATTFTKMTMDQDEAQFLGTLEAQEDKICSACSVFPHEIGITRNMNNSITEQLTINTVTRNLGPFCVDTEQQMNLQLLSDIPSSGIGGGTERKRYFFQDELKSLMRGDQAAQTAHIVAMRNMGIYDGNACAEYLGNPPFEGGDIRVINAAYIPIDMLRQIAASRKTAAPGAPNSSGGAPPTENKRPDAKVVPIFESIEARARKSYAPLFADATGRVASRKKPEEREKSAVLAFRAILSSLACALAVDANLEFIDRYLAALSKRATGWDESISDSVASLELFRACDALVEHGKMTEYREEVKINA